ncbi:hypothetical protein [Actinomadura mexicana]|uniref:DUF8129 domain-containing protein n=1 Tax=Actinomadura mexicana TaxID=134959 RepID=A0A238WW27_9ACTN|nr:hypothetical protein [Actinomadura mexicana]SNR50686.1 hypothetical protein SAMN06265355_103374 [Actinomadura mexicana]
MRKSPRRLSEQVRETMGEQVRDLPLHAVRLAMFGVGRALLLSDRVTRDYKEITEGGGVKPVALRLRDDVQHTAGRVVGLVAERVRGEEPEAEPAPEPARRTRTAAARSATARTATEEIAVGKPGGGPDHKAKHARPGPPPKPARPGALGRHHAKAGGEAGPAAESAPKPVPSEPKPEPAPQAGPAPSPKAAEPAKPAPAKPKAETAKAETAKPRAAEPRAAAAPKGQATEKPKQRAQKKADEAAFEPKPEAKPAAQAEAKHIAEDLPVPDYDSATLPQLRARLRGLSADQVKLLREYERTHAGREDVIRMYERRIAKLNGLN